MRTITAGKTFTIKVGGIYPEGIPIAELTELLSSFDKAIRALMTPAEQDVLIGLVGIQPGSTVLDFLCNRPEQAVVAVRTIAEAVNSGATRLLCKPARVALQQATLFVQRHDKTDIQLMVGADVNSPPLAHITAETVFAFEAPVVQGETGIYGVVTFIGGQKPKAHVRLDTGKVLVCKVTKKLAKVLATRLYESVGLEGIAQWDSEDWSILEFEITDLTDFRGDALLDALQLVATASGDAWGDVEDVSAEIERMRQENPS